MSISFSLTAAQALRDFMDKNNLDPQTVKVRVGVKGGGCSGFSYAFDLSDAQRDSDEVFTSEGITILIDPKSLLYLDGLSIDFRQTLMESGFIFNNPNATNRCGCGSSFSA